MKTPNLAIALLLLTVLLALTLLLGVGHRAHAQQIPAGFAPCSAHSLAVSNTSSNVQLANCGPSLILMNLTTQEAFFNVGQASATTATASNYSIPGNSYLQITVPGRNRSRRHDNDPSDRGPRHLTQPWSLN
jgi:hypothetical protein